MLQFQPEVALVKERATKRLDEPRAVPEIPEPTPEELRRRQRAFAAIDRLREQVKPPAPGNTVDEYIRTMREAD